jgi:hypothetical protein
MIYLCIDLFLHFHSKHWNEKNEGNCAYLKKGSIPLQRLKGKKKNEYEQRGILFILKKCISI